MKEEEEEEEEEEELYDVISNHFPTGHTHCPHPEPCPCYFSLLLPS